jgi:signal transduction histidine kinase
LAIENSVTAVLDLLIDNALGAAGLTGSVVIRLHAENSRAILEVQDDGPGMDEEFVSKELFRPLRTTKSNGYGIGAYQTRHLIREMGGRLEVDTAPNRGTTMRISLPMAADPSGQSSTSS